MSDCLFCKIIAGEIPSTKVYEDESVLAFLDIEPQAPKHIIIIPKEHISSANEITEENSAVIAKVFEAAAKIAKEQLRQRRRADGRPYSLPFACGQKFNLASGLSPGESDSQRLNFKERNYINERQFQSIYRRNP